MWRCLCAALALLTLIAAPARGAPKDAVFNKEGVWGIDVDNGSCAASMTLKDRSVFLLRGTGGEINVAYFAMRKIPTGKTARLETEAYGFDFEPGFGDDSDSLYTAQYIDARMVAALRLAKEVRMLAGGRLVVSVNLENTGFGQALDGLIACSKGESGWWGKGAPLEAARGAPVDAEKAASEARADGERVWMLERSPLPEICTAYALADERTVLVLIGAAGVVGVAIKSDEPMKRGKRGLIEMDAARFAFKPVYDGSTYFAADPPLDRPSLAALREAKGLRVSIDGRPAADVVLEGTGLSSVLDDLFACAMGQAGWWGEGAKQEP